MGINVLQIVAIIVLIISRCVGSTLLMIQRIPSPERPVMFLSGGRRFFLVIGVPNLLLFIAISIYLGLTSWPLLLIGLFVAIVSGIFIPDGIVLRFIIFPLYLTYRVFNKD